jgi:hypothetical protein
VLLRAGTIFWTNHTSAHACISLATERTPKKLTCELQMIADAADKVDLSGLVQGTQPNPILQNTSAGSEEDIRYLCIKLSLIVGNGVLVGARSVPAKPLQITVSASLI